LVAECKELVILLEAFGAARLPRYLGAPTSRSIRSMRVGDRSYRLCRGCTRCLIGSIAHDRRVSNSWCIRRATNRGATLFEGLLKRITQIFEQVKAIGYLHRSWCSFRRARSIGAGTIPADHLRSGMGVQPSGDGRCGAIGEQIKRLVPFQVNNDRAVGVPFALCPIVDANHARRCCHWEGEGAHEAEERVATGRQPVCCCEAGTGSTAEREADRTLRSTKPDGAMGITRGKGGHALRKGSLRTRCLVTKEAPHL